MAKKKKNKKDRVFTDRKRKIFRKNIPGIEIGFSVFFIGFVMAMGVWFATRKDKYDPSERDISIEVLIAQSVEDHLYEPPLQLWVEPGSVAALASSGPDLGIYPPSSIGDGWTLGSRLQVFDETNLYEKINGQEVQYKAYGFQNLNFLAVEHAAEELDISIELYDMGSFQNALGIFAAQRAQGSQVDQRGKAFVYLTEVGALGIVDSYFFKFSGNSDSPQIHKYVKRVLDDFTATASGTGETPTSFMLLANGLNLKFQDIEYQKEDVFQYDFAKEFWFGGLGDGSKARYFVHQAESAEEASELFEQLLEENLYDYTLLKREGNDVVMKHDFLKTFNTLNLFNTYVYGIDAAKDEATTSISLEAIQKLLN